VRITRVSAVHSNMTDRVEDLVYRADGAIFRPPGRFLTLGGIAGSEVFGRWLGVVLFRFGRMGSDVRLRRVWESVESDADEGDGSFDYGEREWGDESGENGNTTLMPIVGGSTVNAFDVDNRMVSSMGGTEFYGYAPDNKRVWKKEPSGVETVYFYGANGQKLVTYTVQTSPFALVAGRVNVYFGGKLIRADGVAVVHDRLGSVVARASCAACNAPSVTKKDYFPYGDEIGGATTGNVDKFGTSARSKIDPSLFAKTDPRRL
jgi:hypothetical protein